MDISRAFERRWGQLRAFAENPVPTAWQVLPKRLRGSRPMLRIARAIFARTSRQHRTPEATYTRYFRNRPLLETIAELLAKPASQQPLTVAVFGCSTGAEVYSLVHVLREHRPDLAIRAVGVDVSKEAIDQASQGRYRIGGREVERLSSAEIETLFTRDGDWLLIADRLRKDVRWRVGDAGDPGLKSVIGTPDVALANNFLVHLDDRSAERCVRNIVSMLAPGGYLCVWGMNLDLRARLALDLDLSPVRQRIEEIHNADERARQVWPYLYWGLEPFDRHRPDWERRYATLYRLPA